MERLPEQPEEELTGDVRQIKLGIDVARAEDRDIDPGTARRIASQLHGGQNTALYSLASCGAIDPDRLSAELVELDIADDTPPQVRGWLSMLSSYAMSREDKGPVAGWYRLTDDL